MPTKTDGFTILFGFDDEGVPGECRQFGRCRGIVAEGPGVERFEIDGPGGEVIEGVDVVTEVFHEYCVSGLRVCIYPSLSLPVPLIPAQGSFYFNGN